MSPCISRTQHVLSTHSFSKKQTSTAMSSTEAEVTAANLALRSVGLPSSCLWSVICHAGGDSTQQKQSRRVEARAKNPKNIKDDYWEHVPYTNQVTRVHVKPRNNPIDSDCPVNLQGLARQRYTIMKTKTCDVEFDLTWDWTTPDADVVNDFEWTGKTIFRIPGMIIGSTFLTPIKLPEFMSNPGITRLIRIAQ